MVNRRILIILAALLSVAACSRVANVPIPDDTTLIMLRHADRDDALLNEKGRARAVALVDALDGVAIDAIYSPNIQRNLDTAAPLAAARGMEILRTNRVGAAEAFLDIVAASSGQTIVWIGNKDNLVPIWEALALDHPAPVEYGDLFIVEGRPGAVAQVTRLRFGPD